MDGGGAWFEAGVVREGAREDGITVLSQHMKVVSILQCVQYREGKVQCNATTDSRLPITHL